MNGNLPTCPCCSEVSLQVEMELSEQNDLRYRVTCPACGVEYLHEDFDSINGVTAFFNNCGMTAQNYADYVEDGEQLEWKCSNCRKKRVTKEGEPAYSFCPDCGAEVLQW